MVKRSIAEMAKNEDCSNAGSDIISENNDHGKYFLLNAMLRNQNLQPLLNVSPLDNNLSVLSIACMYKLGVFFRNNSI